MAAPDQYQNSKYHLPIGSRPHMVPGVLDIRTQPFRLEFMLGGKSRLYTADAMRLTKAGDIEVIEIKSRADRLGRPHYVEKLKAVADICSGAGFRFILATTEAFQDRNVLNFNVKLLIAHRFVEIPPAAEAVVNLQIRAGSARVGELFQKLGGDRHARTQLLGLMARCRIFCDLSRPLTLASLVYPNSGAQHG